jgi:hypothetical protein
MAGARAKDKLTAFTYPPAPSRRKPYAAQEETTEFITTLVIVLK